ncbi:hypothetical protein K1719_000290 [Acacia pycnantha]|nr:hypothetical protein K1719_000290 [Acacia pycnantha]
MGSSYFGDPNMMRNERQSGLSSSSSSSRKGKKNGSDKPKQPQRGLGVAQLEKIRLHAQFASYYNNNGPPFPSSSFNHEDPRVQAAYSSIPSSSSSSSHAASYGFHPNVVMGVPEYERTNIRYDSQPRWHHPNAMLETQPLAQPNVTRPFLNLYDSHHRSGSSVESSSQNSESSDHQELDLELRL